LAHKSSSKLSRRQIISLVLIALYVLAWWYAPQMMRMYTAVLTANLYNFIYMISLGVVQIAAILWFLGRARVYWLKAGETQVAFKDYKGNPEVLEVARRIVTLLKGSQQFKSMGGEQSKGLLLVGPPGTGKSYLAQAIATEADLPFAYASAPSFQNMFFGVSNLKIMMLYRKARRLALEYGAAIVFIDEIDAIGMRRGGSTGMGGTIGIFGAGQGMLNELLLQMDPPNTEHRWWAKIMRYFGLRPKPGRQPIVLTIAATNLPEVLDPALLRPGRFDRSIVIDPPDFDGRVEVVEYYLNKVRHLPSIDVEMVAADMVGYTPVTIKHIVNEAVVKAHFEGRTAITYEDICYAREIHEWGLRQPIKSMSEEERRRIAYHEAGHAVAQLRLQPNERLVKVAITRHGRSLGVSATKPIADRYTLTAADVLARIQVALSSRAAEELFLKTKIAASVSDLEYATRLAADYIGTWGMAGTLYSYSVLGESAASAELRNRINKLLTDQKQQVTRLLEDHAELVHALAAALLQQQELTGTEVLKLAEQHPPRSGQIEPPPIVEAEYLADITLGAEVAATEETET